MNKTTWCVALLGAAMLSCASGSTAGTGDDAGAHDSGPGFDAGAPDASRAGFGEECEGHGDCQSEVCYHPDADAPGYCTEVCTGLCPDGYACQTVVISEGVEADLCVPARDTFCNACDVSSECGDSSDLCVELTAGRYCSVDCTDDPSVCPVGFTCQVIAGDGDIIIGKQCKPTNGICCIDADGDLRGVGEGCFTTDCNDANPAVYDDAAEVCDGYDNDCVGGVDVDVTDCGTAMCQLGALGYFQRAAEPCVSGACQTQSAVMCDLYTCSEGGEDGDTCATACDGEDDGKCIPPAHCDASVCYDDLVNGSACDEASDCESGHCQNGFCCDSGDCCTVPSDCPSYGTFDPVCEEEFACQGSRGEATCSGFICGTTGDVADDSACDSGTLANACGFYLDLYCTGATSQTPPSCPVSCASHADCDANGFCEPTTDTCLGDRNDGAACAEDVWCKSGHCQNGFCCSGGDCCSIESDCPASYSSAPTCTTPTACQGDRDVAQCISSVCSTSFDVADDSACTAGVLASNCGPYLPLYCTGDATQTPPVCPSSCASDADCDANAYCDAGGECVPDEPNGDACQDAAECVSGHCQNGFCCASGDCCANSGDCDAYGSGSVCGDAASCQGTRVDGVCSAAYQCGAQVVDDDSGCAGLESNACGPYPAVFCGSGVTQTAPGCPSSCSTDANCDASAHCDASACVPDVGAGGYCDEPTDCDVGLFCVDNVCCNSACNGTCEACDLMGSVGTCSVVPDGQDPDNECGAVSCAAYYDGYVGDTCYRKADVSAAAASCGGDGACRSAAEECPSQGRGAGVSTCDDNCQNPTPGTCTGTTAGACTNVDDGNHTCGTGVCQVTVPKCVSGVDNACTPNWGAASSESCNDIDDNCDGSIDNGAFSDWAEPNGDCASYRTLDLIGSNQNKSYNTMTIYGSGDNDYYRINASETDSSCSCCDTFCFDEDFRLTVTLTVPVGAGSYMFCTGGSCGAVNDYCVEVLAGTSNYWQWNLDGGCPGNDDYSIYFRIYGDNAPAYECRPYTLSYSFATGCF